MSIFSKVELSFKAQIRIGACIWQDFRSFKWPGCLPGSSQGGGWESKTPEMFFDVELCGDDFHARAPGYGAKGDYGNGCIFLRDATDLIVADADRTRIVEYFRRKKQDQINRSVADLAKLQGEMSALIGDQR